MADDRTSISEFSYCFHVEFSSNPKDAALIWDEFRSLVFSLVILSIERLRRGVERKFERKTFRSEIYAELIATNWDSGTVMFRSWLRNGACHQKV
jgi:hypothetical protein